jgi:hypothetical protein
MRVFKTRTSLVEEHYNNKEPGTFEMAGRSTPFGNIPNLMSLSKARIGHPLNSSDLVCKPVYIGLAVNFVVFN